MNHFSEIMDTGTDHIGVNRKMGTGKLCFHLQHKHPEIVLCWDHFPFNYGWYENSCL